MSNERFVPAPGRVLARIVELVQVIKSTGHRPLLNDRLVRRHVGLKSKPARHITRIPTGATGLK